MKLEDLILESGMTIVELAKNARASATTIYRALDGKKISRTYAQRITNALNASLNTKYSINDLNFNFEEKGKEKGKEQEKR